MSAVTLSVVFGILAAVGWGVADFTAAATAKRIGVLRTATGVHLSSALAAAGYFLLVFEPDALSWVHWLSLACMSLLGVVVYVTFYRALREGPVAVVSPIVSCYALVVIVLAMVFSGERLNGLQMLGATCSIGGVVMASFDPRSFSANRKVIGPGAVFAIATMLSIGLLSYILGLLSRELGWFLPVYITRTMTLVLFIPLAVGLRQWTLRGVTIPLAVAVAIAGIVEMGGMFAYARGAEIGIISIVAAASITYPLIPMLGGILMFGERLALSQWAGLAITLAGLFVLALAS